MIGAFPARVDNVLALTNIPMVLTSSTSDHLMKTIEILYFDGCPTWQRTAEDVRRIVAETGVAATIRLVPVKANVEAERLCFLGSPTVRVDGVDIEPVGDGADEIAQDHADQEVDDGKDDQRRDRDFRDG